MKISTFSQRHIGPSLQLAEKLKMFDKQGIESLKDSMTQAIQPDNREKWLVAEFDEQPGNLQGVVYACSEPMTHGVWNMLMLLVEPDFQHCGVGSQLVKSLESHLKTLNCRMLLVDTSGLPEFENARKFYVKLGFQFQARIPDYFDVQDDKLTFIKYL